MELLRFDNTTGESVVSLLPWARHGPELDADRSRWYRHILVSGERVFQYGSPCGTCGVIFQKLRSVPDRLDDGQAAGLLGTLENLPTQASMRSLAKILQPGIYNPVVLEGLVERVAPGDPGDYFATDGVSLFGLEPPEYEEPFDPGTSYYRFGPTETLARTGRLGGPHTALVTALLIPLQDPVALSRERVEYWKALGQEGAPLTALAVSVIDAQAPANLPADRNYQHEEHLVLTNCLLDGHHRVQAAAELGVPIRVLSFVWPEASLAAEADIRTVVRPYMRELV